MSHGRDGRGAKTKRGGSNVSARQIFSPKAGKSARKGGAPAVARPIKITAALAAVRRARGRQAAAFPGKFRGLSINF
jgi:hypothetical protein